MGVLAALVAGWASLAQAGSTGICERAADAAAARHGVPSALMRAIALVETGRSQNGGRAPWPWAVNHRGLGSWFDDRDAALAHAGRLLADGDRLFDLGCFQINHHHHGDRFQDLAQMIDPATNADYAARFLKSLYGQSGSWRVAAGRYHSRRQGHAERYLARLVGEAPGLFAGPAQTAGAKRAGDPRSQGARAARLRRLYTALRRHHIPE
jgi:hypothetical protein